MIKIMIVDDERNIREGISQLIDWEEMGCEVVMNCANGSIALQYLQSNPVDIVVTDIKMPVMDGLELSKRIHEEFEEVKVIILTAYSDFVLAKQAIKYNVVDFIVKNDFMEELPIAVKKTIDIIMENREKSGVGPGMEDETQNYTRLFRNMLLNGEMKESEIEAYHLKQFNYCVCMRDRFIR